MSLRCNTLLQRLGTGPHKIKLTIPSTTAHCTHFTKKQLLLIDLSVTSGKTAIMKILLLNSPVNTL